MRVANKNHFYYPLYNMYFIKNTTPKETHMYKSTHSNGNSHNVLTQRAMDNLIALQTAGYKSDHKGYSKHLKIPLVTQKLHSK